MIETEAAFALEVGDLPQANEKAFYVQVRRELHSWKAGPLRRLLCCGEHVLPIMRESSCGLLSTVAAGGDGRDQLGLCGG